MLAVLNHELGHWNLGHIVKNIILSQMNYFLCFFLACYINWLKRSFLLCLVFLWQPLCSNWTIDHLPVYFPPLLWGLSFCLLALSHRCDFQADAFAKMLGKAKDIFCFNQTKQKQLWVPCVWVTIFNVTLFSSSATREISNFGNFHQDWVAQGQWMQMLLICCFLLICSISRCF